MILLKFAALVLWPPGAAVIWQVLYRLWPIRARTFTADWIAIAIVCTAVLVLERSWLPAAGSGVSLIAAIAVWWWRRRKRRKVAALIGAKSKALRDALVRKVRESARPRPVFKPQPQGAR